MNRNIKSKFNILLQHRTHVTALSLLVTLLLSACGSAATPPPTEPVSNEVATSVAGTLTAQLTATATTTQTPTATPLPTFLTTPIALNGTGTPAAGIPITGGSTSTASTASGCNDAAFVRDVTIPDGTVVAPGQSFTKTWEFTNTGTCNWTNKYSLVFISGDNMSGSNTRIGQTVAVNRRGQMSVRLSAPTATGTYTGFWQLADQSGNRFGTTVFVQIVVGQQTVVTVVVTATPSLVPDTSTPIPTATAR